MPIRPALRKFRQMGKMALGREARLLPQAQWPWIVLGDGYGAWRVCPTMLGSDSVVYSFGVGDDISFDLALIDRFGVELHAFDPTPRSVAWVQRQALPERFHFHAVGISDRDGTMRLYPPSRPEYVSYSVVPRRVSGNVIEAPMQRLGTVLDELGHRRVDLVKLDVEGAEYAVIDDLVTWNAPVIQLLVEFHHQWDGVGVEQTEAAVRALNQVGFRLFAVSPSGNECSFIRTGEDTP